MASTPNPPEDVVHGDGNEKRKYTFNGFNLVGEEIQNKQSAQLAVFEKIPSDTTRTRTNKTTTATTTTTDTPDTCTIISEPTLLAHSNQSSCIDDTFLQQQLEIRSKTHPPPSSYLHVQNSIILNLDQNKRKTIPNIMVPPLTADIVPMYQQQRKVEHRKQPSQSVTVGDVMESPDTMEPSQSHLSFDVVQNEHDQITIVIAPNTPSDDDDYDDGDLSDVEVVYQN